jgi:hypothetical protein
MSGFYNLNKVTKIKLCFVKMCVITLINYPLPHPPPFLQKIASVPAKFPGERPV